jgi:archaellum biogenesis protein FlaJ (TadC family)
MTLHWFGIPVKVIGWMALASAVMFGLGVLAVPLLIVRIPADYFAHVRRSDVCRSSRFRWLRCIGVVLKNVLGLALLFAGILMLFLPGQGVLTILLAVILLDFPGKYRLQCWVVTRKGVLDSVNWVRRKAGVRPLSLPARSPCSEDPNRDPT